MARLPCTTYFANLDSTLDFTLEFGLYFGVTTDQGYIVKEVSHVAYTVAI